ncbi:putative MFS transporter [Aspergillus steynii IBT 23096]|uniref:Putative MFS transporter n=1 Tax=Aspergillus steynii IBT 23096 TaxID=1392250 RepID=A0A2I2GJZ4_9EURO|nr:putative MFS transporter [Aspergillus steynii IBT 23096]PLB53177.1 putative MFS transporter [Aspergillus steynii IBT 23096]
MGFLNCVGIFRLLYRNHILPNNTPFQLAWIFSAQRASVWAFGPLYGRLIDAYGPGIGLWPLTGICVFELIAMTLTQDYWMTLSSGIMYGLAGGGLYAASWLSVGQWFSRRRGLVAGMAACGGSLGGVIFPLFLDCMLGHANLIASMQYTVALLVIVSIPGIYFFRHRLPIRGWDRKATWFDLNLLRQRHYQYFVAGSFLVMWGYWAPIDFILQSALQLFPPTFGLYLIPIMSLASIPGHIVFGYLGDRVGHYLVMSWCCLLLGASFMLIWIPSTMSQSLRGVFVFALAYGFFGGAFNSLAMPCVAKLGRPETLGQRLGPFHFAMAISCLTGLPIMEALRTLHNGYFAMQVFATLVIILGSIFITAALDILANLHDQT